MPFPHVERALVVRRPALVIAQRETNAIGMLLWALMVTNAERPAWTGDVLIPDALALGLLIPSKVRTAKISTVEATAATPISRLSAQCWAQVTAILAASLAKS